MLWIWLWGYFSGFGNLSREINTQYSNCTIETESSALLDKEFLLFHVPDYKVRINKGLALWAPECWFTDTGCEISLLSLVVCSKIEQTTDLANCYFPQHPGRLLLDRIPEGMGWRGHLGALSYYIDCHPAALFIFLKCWSSLDCDTLFTF